MKLKIIIVFAILQIVSFDINARKIIEEIIEPALIEVVYERRQVLDTLDCDNDFKKDLLTLKVGKSVSAFYSAARKTNDSLEERHFDLVMENLRNKELSSSLARLPKEKVFKNYPENKIRVHDRFDICNWIIDEDWEKPEWTISDSTSNILGYECILASAIYRGRIWEAWFTPEIPISDGPWKLCGLPGLILKAQDSKGHYIYEPVSIRTQGIGNVEYYDYHAGNRFTTTRLKALARKQKSLHEDIRYIIGAMGIPGVSNDGYKKRDVIPHTNYDFEETDYHYNL